jgi:3-deoxy-D-manno-octulosonate 8-phosphate phosphatase (KDO 8-P phosphatase)
MTTSAELIAKMKDIALLILDVDGVLTDGTLAYTENGELVKHFNAKDGFGIRMAKEHHIEVAVISARRSAPIARRMADLQIDHFYTGHDHKLAAFADLRRRLSVPLSQIAFVGDDVLDIPVMRQVGLPIAVADAHPFAKQQALYVTSLPGGRGAVREVTDALIGARTDLTAAYEQFLMNHVGTERMDTL